MTAPNFVPANATIEELEKKAVDCEKRAVEQSESIASALREEANRYRTWIAALRSGVWKA